MVAADARVMAALVLLNLALQVADGLATWFGLQAGYGEGNPFLRSTMLTLGTGIGGGLIFGGQLWRGVNDNAGEIGHSIMVIGGRRCGCGVCPGFPGTVG